MTLVRGCSRLARLPNRALIRSNQSTRFPSRRTIRCLGFPVVPPYLGSPLATYFHVGSEAVKLTARGVVPAERSKPPSVRPGIRLSVDAPVLATLGALAPTASTCTGGDSPFHRSSTVVSRWVSSSSLSIARSSHTSSIGSRRVVSVPEPTVSRPGLAPRHPPGRWGDFPHVCTRRPGSLYQLVVDECTV